MADGQKGQFDALVAPHLERLFRVAYRLLGNNADAQDLVQDTCVIACESLAELATSPHPVRWLLRVQHNRFVDGARRRKRVPMLALDLQGSGARIASLDPGPDELAQQADGEMALEAAFLQLQDAQRVILALRAEGHGVDDIAAITGVPKEVLRARLHRARRSLAQHLSRPVGAPATTGRNRSGT